MMSAVHTVWPSGAAVLRALMHPVSHSLHVLLPLSLFAGALSYHVLAMMAPRYVAEAKFSVWPKGLGQPTTGSIRSATPTDPNVPRGVIAEHVAALASPQLALAIVQDFNLANRAEFNSARGDYDAWTRLARRWGMRSPGTGETDQQRFLSAFARNLQVYSPPQGQAIHIRFTSISADLAASVANRLGATYRSKLAGQHDVGGLTPIDLEVIRRAQPSYVQVFPHARPVSLAAAILTFLLGCAATMARERATTGAPQGDQRADAAAIARSPQSAPLAAEPGGGSLQRVRVMATKARRTMQRLSRLARTRLARRGATLGLAVTRQHTHLLSLAVRRRAAMDSVLVFDVAQSETAASETAGVWWPHRARRLLALIRVQRRALMRRSAAAMRKLAVARPASHRTRQAAVSFASSQMRSRSRLRLALIAALASFDKFEVRTWPKAPVGLRLVIPPSLKSLANVAPRLAAQPPRRGVGPSPAAKLKSSFGAAKTWGASLRDRLQFKSVPAPQDATSEVLHSPVEAYVAAAGVRKTDARPRPNTPVRSDIRSILTLAARLERRRGAAGLRVVIAGVNANVRAAQEALALTHALADRAASTILVDVTSGANGVAHAANLPSNPGLSEVLSGKLDIADAVRLLPGRRAHVLTAGATTKRLSGTTVDDLLQTLSASYDVIVVTGAHAEASRLFRTSAARFDAAVTAGGENKDTFLGHPAGDIDIFNLEVQPNSAVSPDRMRRALDARRAV